MSRGVGGKGGNGGADNRAGPPGGKEGIGVAIRGSGLQAEAYAACLARHVEGAHLATIWGGSHAPELATAWGGRATASAEEAVADPDVGLVIVTTPNTSHAEYVRL